MSPSNIYFGDSFRFAIAAFALLILIFVGVGLSWKHLVNLFLLNKSHLISSHLYCTPLSSQVYEIVMMRKYCIQNDNS